MGTALPSNVRTVPTPAVGDLANFALTGKFTAISPGLMCEVYGAFNVVIWGTANTSLTTTQNSSTATVVSATGLAVGQGINSVNVPDGTTIGVLSGTTITLAFPPGVTNASVVSGTDEAALFTGVTVSGTVNLERSFDGGDTWITCGVGGAGAAASYALGSSGITNPVSIVVAEPELGVGYRLNCVAYTSGTINYRISTTGLAAKTWGVGVG